VFDGKLALIGGTVIIGEDGPVELNPLTVRLPRASPAEEWPGRCHDPRTGVMTLNDRPAYH
jgi:hypothetical protein